MFKILNKIQFVPESNKMKSVAGTLNAQKIFNSSKSKNLKFLLEQRFGWMNNYINENDSGLEVGSGAGFARFFITNKNFKISDLSEDSHLDYKNIDAQNTNFKDQSFDYVVASNMVHHIPYPTKFFKEINRILKKNGKLIIFEPYASLLLQVVTIIMRHEGFDFTVNVWDEEKPKSDENDVWAGNIAVPHLIFDDKKKLNEKLGKLFSLEFEELTECLIFLNSGGVTSKTFFIPMPVFFLKILNYIDKFLVKFFPSIFCLGRKIVLKKISDK